jgi:hypothetical protein
MYGGNKRQRQNIGEKNMALCMGGKKKEKKGMEGKRGGGRKRVGSKVFVFWQNFAKF